MTTLEWLQGLGDTSTVELYRSNPAAAAALDERYRAELADQARVAAGSPVQQLAVQSAFDVFTRVNQEAEGKRIAMLPDYEYYRNSPITDATYSSHALSGGMVPLPQSGSINTENPVLTFIPGGGGFSESDSQAPAGVADWFGTSGAATSPLVPLLILLALLVLAGGRK